jgi:hypothetical protein
MNGALWLLIGLQLRGWLRYLIRSLGTVKGALLALVGLAVFLPWMASVLFLPRQGGSWSAEEFRHYGPGMLLLYCLINVVFSTGERSIYFPPAEVTFLFPGPFGRREILAYKIASTLLVSLPTALFMSLVLRVHASWYVAAFVGMLLMILFMQLFNMAINLLAVSVGTRLYTRGRKLMLAAAVLLGVALALQVGGSPAQWEVRQWVEKALATTTWKVASWPLRWFFDAFTATGWADLVRSATLAALVNAALVFVVFGLDAQYLEASAAARCASACPCCPGWAAWGPWCGGS